MRNRILRIYQRNVDQKPENVTSTTPPPAVAPPEAAAQAQIQYTSPLFFTSAIAGSILVLLLVAFFIYALRKLGFCAASESALSPEEEETQRRREEQAKMRRLRCGVPPHIISSFPVYVFGSDEFYEAVKKPQKKFQQAKRCKDSDSKDSCVSESLLSSECGLQCGIVKGNSSSSCANSEACASNGGNTQCDEETTCTESQPLADSRHGVQAEDAASRVAVTSPISAFASESPLPQAAPQDKCAAKWNHQDATLTVSLPDAGDFDHLPSPPSLPPASGKCQDCSVCLAEFEKGEAVKLLPPCGHYFHVHCITEWLCFRRTCPVCRCGLMKKARPPSLAALLASDPHGTPIQQPPAVSNDTLAAPPSHHAVPSSCADAVASTTCAQELAPPVAAAPQVPIDQPSLHHSTQL